MMNAPLSAVVAEEKKLRFDRTAVNSYRPVVAFTDPFAANVGSPAVAFVSVPVKWTPVPVRVTEPRPKPTSAAPMRLVVVPELVTFALIDKTYGALLLSFSGTCAITNGLVRSEEHTSELQSQSNLVCRLLLEKKKKKKKKI